MSRNNQESTVRDATILGEYILAILSGAAVGFIVGIILGGYLGRKAPLQQRDVTLPEGRPHSIMVLSDGIPALQWTVMGRIEVVGDNIVIDGSNMTRPERVPVAEK